MADLSEKEFEKLCKLEENLLELSIICQQIMEDSEDTKEEIAARMGTTKERLDHLLSGMAYRATVEEFLKFLFATRHRSLLTFSKK